MKRRDVQAGSEEVTQLLVAAGEGDRRAASTLLPVVYTELRRLATARLAALPPQQTLQPTALVHEAYLRLVGESDPGWNGRAHFFGAAAQAMRDILVEQARRKSRRRHGGDANRVPMPGELPETIVTELSTDEMLALDVAIRRLHEQHPRAAQVVMYRYFAGLSNELAAELMETSTRTIERDWRFARAWLHRELHDRHRAGGLLDPPDAAEAADNEL